MKLCLKCGVHVRGENKLCPLCQSKLTGNSEETVYPVVKTMYKQHEIFIKLLVLITVSAGIISAAINIIIPQSGYWSLFVILGIACFWLSLLVAVKNRNNISKNIITQVVLISLLCVAWDYVTGWKGWSLNYVFPIVCMVAMMSLEVLSRIFYLRNNDYQICLIMDIVLGITPLIFLFANMIDVLIPSVICAAMSIVFLTFTLLFYSKEIKKEITKSFHI